MTTLKKISSEQFHNWDAAVARYDEIINGNAAERVVKMSEADLERYCERHNTPTSSREDVLGHMLRWGGFRGMLLAGGLVHEHSALFERLLAGKEPLPHPPPRSFGMPWYELFDEPATSFECAVSLQGMSPRKRDEGKSVWLFMINDCPWECTSANEAGMALIAASHAIGGAKTEGEFSSLVERAKVAFAGAPAFDLRFGRYESLFRLQLQQSDTSVPLPASLSQVAQPETGDFFGWTRSAGGFPAFWVLSSTAT